MVAEVSSEVKIIIPRYLPFGKSAIQTSGNLVVKAILNS